MTRNSSSAKIVLPWDDFNQELVAHVRPPDWINPQPASSYNLVVVGDLFNRTRLTPRVKALFGQMMSWRR
jgi:hypothetical protein